MGLDGGDAHTTPVTQVSATAGAHRDRTKGRSAWGGGGGVQGFPGLHVPGSAGVLGPQMKPTSVSWLPGPLWVRSQSSRQRIRSHKASSAAGLPSLPWDKEWRLQSLLKNAFAFSYYDTDFKAWQSPPVAKGKQKRCSCASLPGVRFSSALVQKVICQCVSRALKTHLPVDSVILLLGS